jgi:hypothetical protein
VLAERLLALAIIPGDAVAAVGAEAAVAPAQEHADPGLVDLAGLAEHLQYVGSEQLFQRLRVDLWGDVKGPLGAKQTGGDDGMEAGMGSRVVAKGVDGDEDAGCAVGQAEELAQIERKAFNGAAAQLGQKPSIVGKVNAEQARDGEDALAGGTG